MFLHPGLVIFDLPWKRFKNTWTSVTRFAGSVSQLTKNLTLISNGWQALRGCWSPGTARCWHGMLGGTQLLTHPSQSYGHRHQTALRCPSKSRPPYGMHSRILAGRQKCREGPSPCVLLGLPERWQCSECGELWAQNVSTLGKKLYNAPCVRPFLQQSNGSAAAVD